MALENKEVDFRAWLTRILKNWYWFVLSCVIIGSIGTWRYFSTTKKYLVDAEITLSEKDAKSMLPQAELMNVLGFGGGAAVEDEMQIMTSRDLMLQVIDKLDLLTEYRKKDGLKWKGQYPGRDLSVVYPSAFLDTTQRTTKISIKVRKNDYLVRVKYGRFMRSRHKVKDLTEPFETCATTLRFDIHKTDAVEVGDCYYIKTTPRLPLVNLYREIYQVAKVKKESNVIVLSTMTDMPSRSRDFIRELIALYNSESVRDKTIMAQNTSAFLDERLVRIEKELAEAEQEEVRYLEANGIVDLDEEAGLFLQENAEFRKQLVEVETQLNLVQFVMEFVKDDNNKDQLIPANLGITDPALIALITEYNYLLLNKMRIERSASGVNPVLNQMNSRLNMMRSNVIATMQSVRETLLIAKNDLDKRFYLADEWREDAPAQIKQYKEVVRTKLMKQKLYLFLYEKREENALSLVAAIPPAKIIAAPQFNPNPLSPNWKYYVLACLFFGIGFPFSIMILHDMLSTRITGNLRDLEKRLEIPLAGVVAHDKGGAVVVRDGESSVSAELFRTLRTNICFLQPTEVKSPVVLVTSSVNDEGKSYVASNLAASMALLGKRVVLVEMDFRKPTLATYLDLSSQGHLTHYLSDEVDALDNLVVGSSMNKLDIIPAGVLPPNPSELLQSGRVAALFGALREKYDYVVVDSAPTALISDTFLLSSLVDMTVYVVRTNHTTFDMIDFVNQINAQQRLPKMLAVLNGVDAKRVSYSWAQQSKKWWQIL